MAHKSDFKRCCELCPVVFKRNSIPHHRKTCLIYLKIHSGKIGNASYQTKMLGVTRAEGSEFDSDFDVDSDSDNENPANSDSTAPKLRVTESSSVSKLQIKCLLELLAAAETRLPTEPDKLANDDSEAKNQLDQRLEIAKAVTTVAQQTEQLVEDEAACALKTENKQLHADLDKERRVKELTITERDALLLEKASLKSQLKDRLDRQEAAASTAERYRHQRDVLCASKEQLKKELEESQQKLIQLNAAKPVEELEGNLRNAQSKLLETERALQEIHGELDDRKSEYEAFRLDTLLTCIKAHTQLGLMMQGLGAEDDSSGLQGGARALRCKEAQLLTLSQHIAEMSAKLSSYTCTAVQGPDQQETSNESNTKATTASSPITVGKRRRNGD
ncbi:hypothetical protein HGRIS_006684 [Hohenbuehelia grisea]|uniref:Uncharacterized protein n=1 Tax=Hohenbuehelia grisea TaxID=104357 RepID=A0ABR3JA90_9AGAR